MPNYFDHTFEGPDQVSNVNLSTSTSTSSTALLSSVRAERIAREQKRRQEYAAVKIQRVWRGSVEAARIRKELLRRLEEDDLSWEARGRGLIVLLRGDWVGGPRDDVTRRGRLLTRWCEEGRGVDGNGIPLFVSLVGTSEGWTTVLSLIVTQILTYIIYDPASTTAGKLLASLENILDPAAWSKLPERSQAEKDSLVDSLARKGWVEGLVSSLDKLVAASLPKRKHPHLAPLTRLLTAPLLLVSPDQASPILPPLLNTLLAVPSLPTVLPIASLTHLSFNLPLFTALLPLGASSPEVLSQGRLRTELGKTHFLANLATFGITGNMLARYGVPGAIAWIKVLGVTLSTVNEGWGRWVEGLELEEDDDIPMGEVVGDDSDDGEPSQIPSIPVKAVASKSQRQRRAPLPLSVRKKLILLASVSHLGTLSDLLIQPSAKAPTSTLMDFASFALGLLSGFRGTPKWEAILDALMEGSRGRALVKRVWREGVRGRWKNSGDKAGWDRFSENPSAPCLLLLTHLLNHYLLLTPDDEFFDTSKTTNPLSLDEILDLAGIWRDLAYFAYSNGVATTDSAPGSGKGTEEDRALFTRGVTRVAERNARQKFASDDFWVMVPQSDLRGFVEAAVYEDAQLVQPDDEEEENRDPSELPRWARARQRFSKRQMAYISPRLGLLNNLPMTVPFNTRLEVFRNFIEMDKSKLRINEYSRRRDRIEATVHRTSLAEDGFRQLHPLGPALKGRITITFIDQWGQEEMGIDGGGLFKEFLTSLSKDVFDTNRGLWLATDQNQLYPNPHSYATETHQLSWYTFIGRILGKAIYEGILVDVSFAGFFLAKWLGRQSHLDDLSSLDKDLYKGLIILKNYPKPEELSLNFTVTEQEFDVTKTIDLIPNGSEIPVTSENRHEYIQLVCRYKLDRQIAAQSRAFFTGLSDIIDSKWLRMFDQQELRQLIGGEESPIDVDDLRAHTMVTGFPNDNTMRMFWRVVKGFDQEQRRALLLFVTSCSRPPLLGFAHLNPAFGIRCAGTDTTRLPSASSCMNLLKLPGYQDEDSLRTKLLQAITSGAGFDLS